ncbi:hypothetical protein ACF1G5_14755 [Streptomyces coeruleorubidus]|uniref:hypothetical protein n=1 Tax=Streptomyces coeruleorubidus TaxID=116188 RepID=UPI003702DB0A
MALRRKRRPHFNARREYLHWIKDKTGDWGTWEPGDLVELGDIGYFQPTNHFVTLYSQAEPLQITPQASRGTNVTGRQYSYGTFKKWEVNLVAKAAQITNSTEKAFLYCLSQGRKEGLANETAILEAARDAVASGDWGLDWVIVAERTTANHGFALKFDTKNSTAVFGFDAARLAPGIDPTLATLTKADISFQFSSGSVTEFPLTKGNTPTFDRTWHLSLQTANQLYGTGADVRRVPRGDRRFRPGHSSLSEADVLSMDPRRLFQLSDEMW